MEVDRGRRRNAWSLENNEQDLGLWEKLYSSKGRIKSSLITTLTWWLPYVLVSALQRSEPAGSIHLPPPSHPPLTL